MRTPVMRWVSGTDCAHNSGFYCITFMSLTLKIISWVPEGGNMSTIYDEEKLFQVVFLRSWE